MKIPSINLMKLVVAVALCGWGRPGIAQNPPAAESGAPSPYALVAPEEINPALPDVLLLGDSISIGYSDTVRTELAGLANVYRIQGTSDSAVRPQGQLRLDTSSVVEHLDEWLGDKNWAVIHFNWGLQDLKLTRSGGHQVELDRYEQNLRRVVARLQRTQAKLIWASTTPVPPGTEVGANARKPGDEVQYNIVAKRVMEDYGIPIDDLHALALPYITQWQSPASVHFKRNGSEALGDQVAASIKEALSSPAGSAK